MSLRALSLTLLALAAFRAPAWASVDVDVDDDCARGFLSTDVTVHVDGERLLQPFLQLLLQQELHDLEGDLLPGGLGHVLEFLAPRALEVSCRGHGSDSDTVACPSLRLAVPAAAALPPAGCARLEAIEAHGLPKDLTVCGTVRGLTLSRKVGARTEMLAANVPFDRFSPGACNDGGCGSGAWFYESETARIMVRPVEHAFLDGQPLDTCSRASTMSVTLEAGDGYYSIRDAFLFGEVSFARGAL